MLDAISNATNAVVGAVRDVGISANLTVAETEIEKLVGKKIKVDVEDIPDDWKEWVMKTGINSLCVDTTWSFLNKSDERIMGLWKARDIEKITMRVWPESECDPDEKWITCWVDWEQGTKEVDIWWYPYAKTWASDNTWLNPGYKRWWSIYDELVFGLQMYQLVGECFYKSDWLGDFEDVDPEGMFPSSTKKFRRWFQFRHWCIYWYGEAQWGYNYPATKAPPSLPDGSLFSLDSILKLPSMPSFSMPAIKLPNFPSLSMPSMPTITMPSMPSVSMPSLSMPSMPEKKKRPSHKYDCHGVIELEGLNVKAKGKTLILSDATITHFYEAKDGSVTNEKKEHQRLELECTDAVQAESWFLSLRASDVKEGDVGGCCNVA